MEISNGRSTTMVAAMMVFAATTAVAADEVQPAVSASENKSSALEEIMVTARRVEESAQRVPIAITAFTAEALDAVNINEITQVQKLVPGVNICCKTFNNSSLTFVRGVQNGAPTYFADVPVSAEGFSNFFDISGFEVLKGPQGTLFGQASNGGAFLYRPTKPGEEFGGQVAITVGDYGRRRVEGAVDFPLSSDRVLLRVAGITSERRGYVRDMKSGKFYGDEDYWIVRPSLIVKLTDDLENYTLYEHSRAETLGFSRGLWVLDDFNFTPGVTPDPLRVEALRRQQLLGPYTMQGTSTGCASPAGPIAGPSVLLPQTLDGGQVACPRDVYIQDRLINTTTFNINEDWSVKNIFGRVWNKELRGPLDVAGSPLVILNIYSPRNAKPSDQIPSSGADPVGGWSNEFQVHGKAGIFDLTTGVFIFRHKYDTDILYTSFNNTFESASSEKGFKNSEGYYFQGNADLAGVLSGLSATAGIRYTKDRIGRTTTAYNVNTLAITGTTGGPNSPSGHADFNNTSYTLGLQYQVTPTTMLYLTNSKGYSSGGLQNVSGNETFAPSSLTNYELGVKSTFDMGSMQARFNASAFYGLFDDVQVFVFTTIVDTNGNSSITGVTKNAAKAKVRGFEAEATLIPVRGLELGGWVAHLDNVFTSFASINPITRQPQDLSNTSFLYEPSWKYGLRASYALPLPGSVGEITFNANLSARTKIVNRTAPMVATSANPYSGHVCDVARTTANGYPASVADGKVIDRDCRRGYTTVDLGVSWQGVMGNENLGLDFLVTNVTENVTSDSQANVPDYGYISHEPAVPRMWTLRTTYKF